MTSLKELLQDQRVTDYTGRGLSDRVRLLRLQPQSQRKADLIQALLAFYTDRKNLHRTWQQLTQVERAVLAFMVRNDNHIDAADLKKILADHNVTVERSFYRGLDAVFDRDSLAHAFLFYGIIPEPILKHLKPLVAHVPVKLEPLTKLNRGPADQMITIGEAFSTDIINVIALVNKTKLRVTTSGGLPTKAAMTKINSQLTVPEPLDHHNPYVSSMRSIEHSTRLYPLFLLMIEADLLMCINKGIELGYDVATFVRADRVEQCQMLLEAYLDLDNAYEFDGRHPEKIRFDCRSNSLRPTREILLKYLKQCPLNAWIEVDDLLAIIRQNDRQLFPTGCSAEFYSTPESFWYPTTSWEHLQRRFLEVALIGYCTTLGLIDVVASPRVNDYGHGYYIPIYLRLTPFGGHVLGVNPEYQAPTVGPKDSGFVVQPNFEIIVSPGQDQFLHCLALDHFAEKVGEGAAPVYKLTFRAIINALDEDYTFQDIQQYLEDNSEHPLPANIITTLQDWQERSSKFSIRTVTILEASEPYLLEELQSYKGIAKEVRQELVHAVEIDPKAAMRIKRQIERKQYFCHLEDN